MWFKLSPFKKKLLHRGFTKMDSKKLPNGMWEGGYTCGTEEYHLLAKYENGAWYAMITAHMYLD